MAKTATVEIKGVQIAEFPCVDQKGRRYDVSAADDLVATFADAQAAGHKAPFAPADWLKPKVVAGHDGEQPLAIASGYPALGWPTRLWREGAKLLADLADVPQVVADLIARKAYRRISASWWPDGGKVGIAKAAGKPVMRHIGLLGADLPAIKTLEDVKALYDGPPPVAAFSDSAAADVDVAEFADAAPAAPEAPQSLKAAVAGQGVEEELQPLIRGIQNRMWAIQDEGRKGKTREEVLAALEGLASELTRICGVMRAQPGIPPAAAAAEMADKGGEPETGNPPERPGGQAGEPAAAATLPAPAAAAPPAPASPAAGAAAAAARPAEMSDASRQTVEVFLTRTTAAGRLLPKHHPSVRAQAAAMFAHGGEEAVAAYIDDEDGRRQAKVIQFGEAGPAKKGTGNGEPGTGAAEFADLDPAAVADAGEEFERLGIGRSLGISKGAFIRARSGPAKK
jgi:hypothetical protein